MNNSELKVHVLLVDDEEEFLAATAPALRRRGFLVSTARDGKAALRLLQRDIIDVAVLDVKMPGLSGDEVYRVMRARWPELPVLMLTGHGTISQAFSMSRDGVAEYLAKPCDIDALVGSLRKAVEARRDRVPLADGEDLDDGLQVLVIDDEQDLLDVLTATLRRRGVVVATARRGAQGLELMARRDFEVVLLDLKLQGEHGLDVLVEIKRRHPDTEVILHTGDPSADSAVQGLQRGAFDYIRKPTDLSELLQKLRAARQLRRQRLARQQQREVQDLLRGRAD